MRGAVQSLVLGNGLGQAMQFASLVLLSRIYSPTDFGLLAQVQSIATFGCVIATLQLHLVIPLEESNSRAGEVVKAVEGISITITICMFALLVWFGRVWGFAVVLSLFLALTNTYNSWLVHAGNFGALSRFYVARATVLICLQLTLALAPTADALIWATLITEALAAAYLRSRYVPRSDFARVTVRDALNLIQGRPAFSFYGTVQELVAVSAFYAPLVLFAMKFDDGIAGQYAMASRLVWAPVILFSGSIGQVLYHRFGKFRPTSMAAVFASGPRPIVLMLPFAVAAMAFPLRDGIQVILGSQWGLASQLFAIHVLWGALFLTSVPVRTACRALELQRRQLTVDAMLLVCIGLLFAFANLTPVSFTWALVGLAAAQNAALAVAVHLKLRERQKGSMK